MVKLVLYAGGTGGAVMEAWLPLGLVSALIVGGRLAADRRVPPVLMALVLSLPGLLGLLFGLEAWSDVLSELAHPDPTAKLSPLPMFVTHHLITDLLPGLLVALPATVLILACGLTGVTRGPRRWALPLVTVGLSMALAAAPLVALAPDQALGVEPLARAGLYLALGLGTSAALVGKNPMSAGPAAGATAALTLPLVVGALELSSMTLARLDLFEALAHAPSELKSSLMLEGLDAVATQRPYAWLALGLASAVALLGTLAGLHRSPRPAAVLAGLALLAVPALALWFDAHQTMLLLDLTLGG